MKNVQTNDENYTLLEDEKQWRKWVKEHGFSYRPTPVSYPCLAYCAFDAQEDVYPRYIYKSDVEAMSKAFSSLAPQSEQNEK